MTGLLLALIVALAGGLGAVARFVLDSILRASITTRVPSGTFFINLSGSLLLGVLAGLVLAGVPADVKLVAGSGFMGGYTTFSTATLDTMRLIGQRHWVAGVINGLGMLVLSVVLAVFGLVVGQILIR